MPETQVANAVCTLKPQHHASRCWNWDDWNWDDWLALDSLGNTMDLTCTVQLDKVNS